MTVRDLDVAGRSVLLRVDFNVPFNPDTGDISDDSRILASLATIRYLAGQQCRVVVCSHFGRPKGRVMENMRMQPISERLSQLIGAKVLQSSSVVGLDVIELVQGLPPGGIIALENVRFDPGEENNDPCFAKRLSQLADIYVNDAFGAAHRAHASTVGVTKYLPSVAGMLMDNELRMLGGLLNDPKHPFVAVLGGAKVSDKINTIQNLAGRIDALVIGGGMAATFLKANGLEVGISLVEDDRIDTARKMMLDASSRNLDIMLPLDVVVADSFSQNGERQIVGVESIPERSCIMDIGPRTSSLYSDVLQRAGMVLWNGPMGVYEWEPFSHGTAKIARTLSRLRHSISVIGGGSTADAVKSLGLENEMSHVSTGGGASLEFLEGKLLPGVECLMEKV